jgi:hypothetical protein
VRQIPVAVFKVLGGKVTRIPMTLGDFDALGGAGVPNPYVYRRFRKLWEAGMGESTSFSRVSKLWEGDREPPPTLSPFAMGMARQPCDGPCDDDGEGSATAMTTATEARRPLRRWEATTAKATNADPRLPSAYRLIGQRPGSLGPNPAPPRKPLPWTRPRSLP